MNNFTFTQDDCKEETTSTWLIAVMQFGLKINLFKSFEGFKLKMKEVKYSVYQKLITTIMSVVIGCEITKDINEKLGAKKFALNLFGMDTVPDQSQINELLRRFDLNSTNQLESIHNSLFTEHSNSIYSPTGVVVDCDQSGLIANAYSTRTASNLAKGIDYSEYTQADKAAWVYELPENNGARYIIVQTLSVKGNLKYSLLITNISRML